MPIKLTYFNARGLAEPIRMLLKIGNIDFEDVRFEKEDWPAIKPSTPFGVVPLYEEDGKAVCQSLAIMRHVAKKVNLVGATDWENLEIDAIADTINDLWIVKTYPIFSENDAEKKEALKKTFIAETAPFYLERFEKLAAQNGGHLAFNKLTWVDVLFVTALDLITKVVGQDLLEKYPNLLIVKKNINEHPAISPWIETRPITMF